MDDNAGGPGSLLGPISGRFAALSAAEPASEGHGPRNGCQNPLRHPPPRSTIFVAAKDPGMERFGPREIQSGFWLPFGPICKKGKRNRNGLTSADFGCRGPFRTKTHFQAKVWFWSSSGRIMGQTFQLCSVEGRWLMIAAPVDPLEGLSPLLGLIFSHRSAPKMALFCLFLQAVAATATCFKASNTYATSDWGGGGGASC